MNDNLLSKYLGRNVKNIISNVEVVQGTAKETGNIYYAIEISFINGYKKRLYLRSDEQFAWVNAIEQLESQVQVNAEF